MSLLGARFQVVSRSSATNARCVVVCCLACCLLGVQSRSEVGWIVSESPWLVCPSFADVLVGSEPPQGLEALSEVVGVEERFEVLSELRVGLVVIAPNGGFLESAVHPLDLTVGPGMFGLVRRCSMPCSRQMRSNMCNL